MTVRNKRWPPRVRVATTIAFTHIGGATPSRPTLIAGAVIVPSDIILSGDNEDLGARLEITHVSRNEPHDGDAVSCRKRI
jgi:hypothetical protein